MALWSGAHLQICICQHLTPRKARRKSSQVSAVGLPTRALLWISIQSSAGRRCSESCLFLTAVRHKPFVRAMVVVLDI